MFEVKSGYRADALQAYGTACEWIGCGWNAGSCDAHHIDYQEHQEHEDLIRKFSKLEDKTYYIEALKEAKELGYLSYDVKEKQLEKDNTVHNIAVLCPNHHRFVHTLDLGMKLLDYIPERKASV